MVQTDEEGGDEVLTVAEVAGLLRVSTATVYAMCERGELAHFRVLNAIRIPVTALSALISVATVPAKSVQNARDRD